MAVQISRELKRLVPQLRYEPTAKRLRARLGDELILDSHRAIVVWEPGRHLPVHAVPEDDVVARLEPAAPGEGRANHTADGELLTVRAGAHTAAGQAFRLSDPDLSGYIVLETDAFDWFEEDELVVGHPRDPFARIDIRATSRRVRVLLDGAVLAATTRSVILFEGQLPPRTYIPREDVNWGLLQPVELVTVCPYKGHAHYWTAPGLGDGRPVAWSYGPEFPEMAQIHGLVAFFDERTDVEVDGRIPARPATAWT
ncbi:DUF427 domain-containing protein [Sinomonas sp. P47F7]|uniref:DUF427 domain-containing protein n=1 Tax=Sinomonas sp. P47F7 TaxID=3410987 RepID=UPI003BF52240